MLGTSEGTFCPLSKLWCKSPQTESFGPERKRFLYKVELRISPVPFHDVENGCFTNLGSSA